VTTSRTKTAVDFVLQIDAWDGMCVHACGVQALLPQAVQLLKWLLALTARLGGPAAALKGLCRWQALTRQLGLQNQTSGTPPDKSMAATRVCQPQLNQQQAHCRIRIDQ
jgi:hypothetical protein